MYALTTCFDQTFFLYYILTYKYVFSFQQLLQELCHGKSMAQSWLFLLLWLLESLVASTDNSAADSVCPKQCVCKWKRGKESIFCSQAGFYQVPKLHYTGTQVNTLLKVCYIALKVGKNVHTILGKIHSAFLEKEYLVDFSFLPNSPTSSNRFNRLIMR